MNINLNRREFLKLGAAGVATITLGSHVLGLGAKNAFAAASQTLEITITDGLKDMVTHNAINNAQCYFWIYKMTLVDGSGNRVDIPPDCPGPTIYAINGDTIDLKITNTLTEDHSFFIPGPTPTDPAIFDSGVLKPGETKSFTFTASRSGAHLYYDNLNAPVNRQMGLHGALVVRPAKPLG
ncbi:MAG TPA: multicopper oxidase domain-containing protein, partial [Geobacteraceae bacterium]